MEGLEAAIIEKSRLGDELRYEAEFFRKKYLVEDSALSKLLAKPVAEFAMVTDGPHGYHVIDEKSSIAMLTAKNAKDWFAGRESADTITKEIHSANLRSSLESEDIILSTRGTVGMCAIVVPEVLPANLDQDVARITWSNRDEFLPEYVLAFLNSVFGQDYIHRYASGMVQQGISLQKVRAIPIPLLSDALQKEVRSVLRLALEFRRSAVMQIRQAEEYLLDAFGLENWQPPEPLTYTDKASSAVTARRCDAEFLLPASPNCLRI